MIQGLLFGFEWEMLCNCFGCFIGVCFKYFFERFIVRDGDVEFIGVFWIKIEGELFGRVGAGVFQGFVVIGVYFVQIYVGLVQF